jgi:hypothetical protein
MPAAALICQYSEQPPAGCADAFYSQRKAAGLRQGINDVQVSVQISSMRQHNSPATMTAIGGPIEHEEPQQAPPPTHPAANVRYTASSGRQSNGASPHSHGIQQQNAVTTMLPSIAGFGGPSILKRQHRRAHASPPCGQRMVLMSIRSAFQACTSYTRVAASNTTGHSSPC